MSASAQALVLDRDGVLTKLNRDRLMREVLCLCPLSEEEMSSRWRDFLAGQVLRSAGEERAAMASFLRAVAQDLDLDHDAQLALSDLDYLGCVEGFEETRAVLLDARSQGVCIAMLSNNTAALSPRRQLEAAGLDDLIDVALSSQMVGARKPDPLAYIATARALNVPIERCVFVDNTLECVKGAGAAGMSAWLLDRSRSEHDLRARVLRDLTAVPAILARARRFAANPRSSSRP